MSARTTALVRLRRVGVVLAAAALAGCVTVPSGPRVPVYPGTGKSFNEFQSDDARCRNYAYLQSGGKTPEQAAVESGVGTAAITTAIGAIAGAAFGGGQGAAIGAGSGLLVGSAIGSSTAYASGYELQGRYDSAYTVCMYSLGNKVPAYGLMPTAQAPVASRPPPPPPPPGAPPAPPLR